MIHIPLSSDPVKDAEARRKIRVALTGKPKSRESVEKMRKSKQGKKIKPFTDEHKRKISIAATGRKLSEETKKKLSCIRKGRKLSEEHKKKLGESHLGSHRSEETKRKMSIAAKGKVFTEEHKKNLSKANLGNPLKSKENCHMWKGGISFEPYCPKFNREFKERVRAFFDYTCPECLTPQNGMKLHVHHVNFDKMTCCNDTIPLFVPLCQSCHAKTRFDREYWEQYFTDMIEQYYEGKCYFTQEEMKENAIS